MIFLPSPTTASKNSNSAYKLLCAIAGFQFLSTTMAQADIVLKQQISTQGNKTTVPQNFALSFDLTPTGLVDIWSSIIHYTGDGSNMDAKGRIPAIWFSPGTTQLHVRVATPNSPNEGIGASTRALPLNAKTSVRVEAFGRDVLLFLNNTLDSFVTVSADRIYGPATVYVSDPWHPAAIAKIASVNLTSITALTNIPVSAVNGPLSLAVGFEKTTVPQNFALSFDLTPTGLVGIWSSIIHYTGDGSNMDAKGRMPAIWFAPGTTQLHVRVATPNSPNEGIHASTRALPLNAKTSVRVEAFGRELRLFLNGTLDSFVTVSADRIFGPATVYVSDPWHPAAIAKIASIQLSPLVYYDDDLRKFATLPAEISSATATVYTTISTPMVVIVNATVTDVTESLTPSTTTTTFATSTVSLSPVIYTVTASN